MEGDDFADIGIISTANQLHDERDTKLIPIPERLPLPVEVALAQYADSIEGLSAGGGTEADQYTRGFLAGLRAAIKVAANVIGT
jgi:hypothetical protein